MHSNPLSAFSPSRFRRAAGLLLSGCLAWSGLLHAQQDLETSVPANWSAAAGTLSISSNHSKMGSESLRWNWSGGNAITISSPGINAADVTGSSKSTCDFWVWNGTPVPGGKLRVEFMNGPTAQYWFDFYLDYTGWRRAVRSYPYDMAKKTSPSSTFTSVRISAPAAGSGSFYIDAVTWTSGNFSRGRQRDAQNIDIGGTKGSTWLFDPYQQVPDIAAITPTAAELAELATLRSRWLASVKGGSAPSATSLTSANDSFAAMSIVDDPVNGIRGQVVNAPDPIDGWSASNGWAMTLAQDYTWGTATANASRDKMLLLARHLVDQGYAENSNSVPGIWYNFMNLPRALAMMGPACDANTKAQLWDFFRWNYRMGEFWTSTWERNTDDIYCGGLQVLGAILFLAPDDTESVRMLKGYKRYLNRFLAISEGSEDGIKPDGTGFHHRSHYNNYMYAWGPMVDMLHQLRDTSFQVDLAACQSLRTTILAMMRMSADGTGTGIGYFGNALCGRKPMETDVPVSRDHLRRLGEIGGKLIGEAADPILARAYNRRFGVNDYALFTPYGVGAPPDGFLQFNYSPLGIYRRANWVASMRAPQRFFWSSEIFSDYNLYGRYQSYGALEVLYHGGRAMSGEQLNGWDWNQPPGTTTIVLPDSKLIATGPVGVLEWETIRSQINFSGALAFRDGQSGLYAGNFQEDDTSPYFSANHNTTFKWRKSWFAFGSEIVCLGSDIVNNDTTNRTVTTLFQGALATQSTAITLDGGAITSFPNSSTASGASAHWLLDACGTGYVVPTGTSVQISRATQTSAHNKGTGTPTTGDFAKAWLDHGTAPAGAGYEYAVLPGTTAAAMTTAASQHADSATKPYQVIQRDTGAHVVKWKADGKTGYAIFTTTALPSATQSAGLLTSVQRPCLVMAQGTASDNDAWISVVDPDLNFTYTEALYGRADASRARTLDVTVSGVWLLDHPEAGISIVSTTATSTTLRVTTQHGAAEHVHLVKTPQPYIGIWANQGSDWNNPVSWGSSWGDQPPANNSTTDLAKLGTATVQPVLNAAYAVKGITLDGGTTLSGTGNLTLGASGIATTGIGNGISLANLTLATSQTWNNSGGALTVSSAISGNSTATLTKSGGNALTLSGANSYLGGTIVSAGSITVSGNQSAANGGWTINAGVTVDFKAGSTVTVASGKSIQLVNASSAIHTLNAAGTVTASGSLSVAAGSVLNINSGANWTQNGSMTVQPNTSYFTPVMNVNAGSSFTYAGTLPISLSSSISTNGGSATLNLSGGTFTTGKNFHNSSTGTAGGANLNFSDGGTLKLSADIASLATTAGRPFNLTLGTGGGVINTNGFSTTLAQGISGAGGLTKSGSGALTLSGSNTFAGATNIANGTLAVTGSLANGPVTVSSSATLAGNGSIGGAVNVQAGGALAPSGALAVNNTLTLAGSALMEIAKSGTVTGDKVAGISTITYGGNLTVTHLGPNPLAAGDSLQLFAANSYQGAFAGISLPALASGLVWNTSRLSLDGSISVRVPTIPIAVADSASTPEDTQIGIAVLANDSDADLDPLAIQAVTQGAHGAVAIVGNQVTYTPAANWSGSDSFGYTVTDNRDGIATASVSVTVTPVNDTPVFGPLAARKATEDVAFSTTVAASDADTTDTLTYAKTSGPAWLTVATNGTLGGTPANGDVGPNTFVLRATDSANAFVETALTVTVDNVNDAPVFAVNPFSASDASEAQAYSASIAGSASDVDANDSFVYSKVSGPAWLTVGSNGSLTGTPGSGDTGSNSFVVRAIDAANGYTEATLNILVIALDQNGVWTSAVGGSWPVANNWSGGLVASGANRSADFSTLNLTADTSVTLDGSRTLGALKFGDATTVSNKWTVNPGTGGTLTLATTTGNPTLTTVASGDAVTLNLPLAGTQTIVKAGPGTLNLAGPNTFTGLFQVDPVANTIVNVSGNQSAATGGWTIRANATVNFQTGSTIALASGKSITLANESTGLHTLNVAGTVTGNGGLSVHSGSVLNINSGANWTQNGNLTIQPLQSYFTPVMNINAGGSFTYAGTSAISLSSSINTNGGSATLNLNGGTFTTGKNFNNSTTATATAGVANLTFSAGGTLKLSASIASLATTAGRPFNVTLGTGGGVMDTNGFSTTLALPITGSGGLTKAGGGTLTTTGANSYTGNTIVTAGTLSVATAGFSNASSVTIAAGATLNLNFTGADTVAALTIGGSSLPPGTYSAATHPATITGTGSLTVIHFAAPQGFASWAMAHRLSGELGSDSDQDGIADALEFVFGSDPNSANVSAVSSQKSGGDFIFTFTRDDQSENAGLQLVVEAGEDLQSWPQAFQIGSTTETSGPGVTITENGEAPDTVTVTISTNGTVNCFTRLKVMAAISPAGGND